MQYVYTPKGVCSRKMTVSLDGDILSSVQIEGGCSGNIQAMCRLVSGMKAADAVSKIKGIKCGFKQTSCPDQLSIAIENAMKKQSEQS